MPCSVPGSPMVSKNRPSEEPPRLAGGFMPKSRERLNHHVGRLHVNCKMMLRSNKNEDLLYST